MARTVLVSLSHYYNPSIYRQSQLTLYNQGHFYLTKLLLPVLLRTARESPDGKSRVITTSSSTHMFAGPGGIDWDTLRDGPKRRKMGVRTLYSQSKFVRMLRFWILVRFANSNELWSTGECCLCARDGAPLWGQDRFNGVQPREYKDGTAETFTKLARTICCTFYLACLVFQYR